MAVNLDNLRQEGWPDAADEIERLRKALEPFAKYAAEFDGVNWLPDPCPVVADPSSQWRPLTVGDLRLAQATLASGMGRGD